MPDGDGYLSEFNTEGAASRTAEKYRALNAGKWHPAGGISAQPGRRPGGLVLSALTSPNRWQVTAGFGVAVSSTGDVYEFSVSANASDNVAATSSGTTRLDRFVVRVRDKSRGDTENSVRVERIAGTETTGTPVLPTTGLTGAVFLDVGTMLVNSSGPSTVTPSNVFLSALGGIRPVTQAQRDALVAAGDVYPGLSVFDTTNNALITRNNLGGWDGLWQSYTPTWMTNGTNRAVGNGSLTGRYIRWGRLTTATVVLVRGSTTELGDGNYAFGLPVAAANFRAVNGSGIYARVSPFAEYALTVRPIAVDAFALLAGTSTRVSNTQPFAPSNAAAAVGDSIAATVTYEAAV